MKSQILTGRPVFTSLKPLDLSTCTKRQIQDYFENSYDLYETLFTSLNDDMVFYLCPDRLRLPLVFYFAHTAVVYVNKLMLAGFIQKRINHEFETMFETGVDEMSWDDTENYRLGGSYKWPSIESVVEYRLSVRRMITDNISDTPLQLPITMDSPWWAMIMGFEHDRIHLETSSVLIRQLPVDMVTKPDGWVYAPIKFDQGVKEYPIIHMNAADVTMGKPDDFPTYGWDNEYGQVKCHVPTFLAAKYLITNKEYLEFVQDGGYSQRNLWTASGWQWKEFRAANHPPFWICIAGCKSGCGASLRLYSHCTPFHTNNDFYINNKHCNYRYRAMFDDIDLPMDWPVEVTYHEAKAFCAWKGPEYRLPAEAEHHIIRGTQKSPTEGTASDIVFQNSIPANLNLKYGSSSPVNLFGPNDAGFCDVFGNVWEWQEDHFNGLHGFQTHHFYDDFSTPCFDGNHHMILGGSWIATGDEASRFARFAFRPHFVQHVGFRLVKNIEEYEKTNLPVRIVSSDVFVLGAGEIKTSTNLDQSKAKLIRVPSTNYHYIHDTDDSLCGILELEFGYRDSLSDGVMDYCTAVTNKYNSSRRNCIVFGAGAGKLVFLMSKLYDTVLGVDICARFIDAAKQLHETRRLSLTTPDGEDKLFNLDIDINNKNITFKQMTWISNEIIPHDLVLLTNLHRLQNPKAWLLKLWEIVRSTGLLIIVSVDNQWKEDVLLSYLCNKFVCIDNGEIMYQDDKEIQGASVTVWKLG